jgi:hypothetical protein
MCSMYTFYAAQTALALLSGDRTRTSQGRAFGHIQSERTDEWIAKYVGPPIVHLDGLMFDPCLIFEES